MTTAELVRRLEALEKTVEGLKSEVARVRGAARWWVVGAGRFRKDPDFDQIVELGRQYRDSLKPKRKKGKRDRS